jgi:hypothetical protein
MVIHLEFIHSARFNEGIDTGVFPVYGDKLDDRVTENYIV